MPVINVSIEVSNEQLIALLQQSPPAKLVGIAAQTERKLYGEGAVDRAAKTLAGDIEKSLYAAAIAHTLIRPGADTSRGTIEQKLTDAGLKRVWELHNDGVGTRQISKMFNGVISRDAVRRFVGRVKLAGKKR